ncbi:PLDc N-terminal domain-containing protein [Agromyces sp. G08B096]|uniref:PLDc N-terminal domain-containing protein n=1 Tax=Agromyces sp. G08B096 TaxID=3156399 RepID=A0AAU7W5G3_9MICO
MPVLSLLLIVVVVVALIDIITRGDWQVKHLPKFAWILLVVLLPLIGSILWFTIGRDWEGGGVRLPRPQRRPATDAPAPAAHVRTYPVDTRSTEEQLADLDREIEEWERRRELESRRSGDDADAPPAPPVPPAA